MRKIIITTILIFLIAVAGAGLYFWASGNKKNESFFGSIQNTFSDNKNQENGIKTVTLETVKADMKKYSPDSQINLKTRTYTNKKYGFSVKIPENMVVSNFQEGRYGEVILIQGKDDSKKDSAWVQVFALPFDEKGLVTPQRIHKDLPELEIDNPKYVVIGKNKFKALIFWSNESGLGKTREIWFERNGYLFQITTIYKYERILGEMLETISFGN